MSLHNLAEFQRAVCESKLCHITGQEIQQQFWPILRRAGHPCVMLGALTEFAADGPMARVPSAFNELG